MRPATIRPRPALLTVDRERWQFSSRSATACAYLAAIIAAEFCGVVVDARFGLALDAAILILLIHRGAQTENARERALLWGLAVAPLIRIISLSLPLERISVAYWYAIISLPVFAATVIAARALGYAPRDLGLSVGVQDLPIASLAVPLGVALGFVEYLILRSSPLESGLALRDIWLPTVGLIVPAALGDEIVFRGLVQRAAVRSLGRWGLVYVAVLYAGMSVGYRSAANLAFVFLVGLLLTVLVQRRRSLLGAVVAHASLNVGAYVIAPSVADPGRYILVVGLVVLTATALGLTVGAFVAVLAPIMGAPRFPSRTEIWSYCSRWPRAVGSLVSTVTQRRWWAEQAFLALYVLLVSVQSATRVLDRLRSRPGHAWPSSPSEFRACLIDLRNGAAASVPIIKQMLRQELVPALVSGCKRLGGWTNEQILRLQRAWRWERGSQSQLATASPAIATASGSDDSAHWIERGISSMNAGNDQEAHRYFCRALEVDPRNVRAWFWRAKTSGSLDEVVRCLERAVEIEPENRLVAANLVLFRRRQRAWRQQGER